MGIIDEMLPCYQKFQNGFLHEIFTRLYKKVSIFYVFILLWYIWDLFWLNFGDYFKGQNHKMSRKEFHSFLDEVFCDTNDTICQIFLATVRTYNFWCLQLNLIKKIEVTKVLSCKENFLPWHPSVTKKTQKSFVTASMDIFCKIECWSF